MSLNFLKTKELDYILAVNIGHNTCAILSDSNGNIICGYEEERLTKIKGDHSFPKNSIKRCLRHIYDQKRNLLICVSHWFNYNNLNVVNDHRINKYYYEIREFIKSEFNDAFLIKDVISSFDHHDLHAYSVISFVKNNLRKEKFNDKKNVIIVMDGFGNFENVISLYESDSLNNLLDYKFEEIKKYYNVDNSLGLFYQYMTSAVGMKEMEDEYKFLGYESHIDDIMKKEDLFYDVLDLNYFDSFYNMTKLRSIKYLSRQIIDEDKLVNDNKLQNLREHYHNLAKNIISFFLYNNERIKAALQENKIFYSRVLIGHFIQFCIEKYLLDLIKEHYKNYNVFVAGGLFYNVKLNNRILNEINGLFSIMPLAGDQGCSIGFLDKILKDIYKTDLKLETLNIGKRYLAFDNIDFVKTEDIVNEIIKEENITNVTLEEKYKILKYIGDHVIKYNEKNITDMLINKNIVNLIQEDMEYGPRALCNTSTLALPLKENVDCINLLNKRNTVMPFAPVMLRKNIDYFFDKKEYEKVIGSDQYMILTYIYNKDVDNEKYCGIMHKLPFENTYSGRPQIFDNKNNIIYDILEELDKNDIKAIINTSFNVHSVPIVFDVYDAICNFIYNVIQKFINNIEKDIYLCIKPVA